MQNGIRDKIKKFFSNIYVQNIVLIILISLSFGIIDLYLRYFGFSYISYYKYTHLAPNLFTLSYILIIIGFVYLLPKKGSIIFLAICNILANVLFIAETLHMKILDRFFSFSDLLLGTEAESYLGYAIKKTDLKVIIFIIISILLTVISCLLISKKQNLKRNKKYFIITLSTIIITVPLTRYLAINRLGNFAKDPLAWDAAFKPRNVYNDFNNQTKSLELSGMYELLFRSMYLYYKDLYVNNNKEDVKNINEYIKENQKETLTNDYTAIFKDKNLILVLLESVDSWILSEETTPTLLKLQREGLNFTNRYAPAFGSGQTINSEFAVNTGLYSVGNTKAIYNFDRNDYRYSLPNLFKNEGYTVNSIHANSGNFYNRSNLHIALGYEKHHALKDDKNKPLDSSIYFNDTTLVKDDYSYNLIVPDSDKFMSFVITYTPHVPYDNTNSSCKDNPYNLKVKGNQELSCYRNLIKENDEFLKILLERLEVDKKLDDTVLVLFTDHYSYGYEDQAYVKEQKQTKDTNLLQNVPFIIWSKDIESEEIDTIMDTADILPTIANLFGLDFDLNNYMGDDVFSENHEKFVYFPDGSWYDGTIYSNDIDKINVNEDKFIAETSKKVNTKIKINEEIILSDYFKNREAYKQETDQ